MVFQGEYRTGLGGSQSLFYLSPALFNGVEVRRIGWQVQQQCTGSLDLFAHALHLVRRQIVHHHHVARFQLRTKGVFEISSKDIAVGGRLDRHRGDPPGAANRAQQSERAPAAAGRALTHSLARQGASIAPCHVGADATFIQEDQFFRIDLPGLFLPNVAGDLTGSVVLLGGVERLFLSRSSISPSNFHKRPMLAASASSSRIFLCNSCSVKSGCAVIHSRARC